eukprot:TRINITY_DN2388_c0_g1_i1.p1 TRINITY_DN2388_c0_g1~~TRINITY_DN2388_c0_g1_i1.p1  ORF type:complete len:273 (+),score=48.97 TRINITY_DN2388_c0_g1_i1:3-821(+)
MGFAQAGLLPIVEIPYAKYLDCGADMFYEAIIMNWLSQGKQSNGMIFRLQGFGAGVFGGNSHTHNALYLPPGLDVVCYSNGPDWVRGLRYAAVQAKAGRVVMMVDCTNLLNLRHLHEVGDREWLSDYAHNGEMTSWHEVTEYGSGGTLLAIVTYGNSLVHSLQAQKRLKNEHNIDVTVIDSPLLSEVSEGLQSTLSKYHAVLFADDCKVGQSPLSSIATQMHSELRLPLRWKVVGAQPTYNPLGTTLTFTSTDDIVEAALSLIPVPGSEEEL